MTDEDTDLGSFAGERDGRADAGERDPADVDGTGDEPGTEPEETPVARNGRDEHLAALLESVAADLRAGEATVYGYRVRSGAESASERGAVDAPTGWLAFELERER